MEIMNSWGKCMESPELVVCHKNKQTNMYMQLWVLMTLLSNRLSLLSVLLHYA
jgi:hypothetical protein